MSVSIVPIAPSHAAGFHACLDAVAREQRYLAQIERAIRLYERLGFARSDEAARHALRRHLLRHLADEPGLFDDAP